MPDPELDSEGEKGTVASTPQLRRLGRLLVVAGVAIICGATLIPQSGQPETTAFCIVCGSLGGVDFLLNILLFVPLAVGLALSGTKPSNALVGMIAFSVAIEVLQFFFISGRDASIGDVLSNSIGGALGFVVARHAYVWRFPSARAARRLCVGWGALWLLIQLISSYAFTPQLPGDRYYGQIARVFENMATFGGQVLSANIDTVTVPDFGFARTADIREALSRNGRVKATVIPAGPTPKIAPILRVANEEKQEIVMLGQNGSDLVFGVRTGAANLRLREPRFVLRRIFPAAANGAQLVLSDTLKLAGEYSTRSAVIRVDSAAVQHQRVFPVTPSLAWMLILPANRYLDGGRLESILSVLWVAALLVPLGFWIGFLFRDGQKPGAPPTITLIGGVLALLVMGFVLIPMWMGLRPASASIWLGSLVGLVAGYTVSVAVSQRRTY